MNIYPTLTNLRSSLSYEFSALRMRASRDAFWAKLTGKNLSLTTFPSDATKDRPNKKFLGINEISVRQIIGTLNRNSDFDHKFRPLKKHLLNRWVNTLISLGRDEWAPIVVHKLGENYYVENGHHRVSVARATGMVFIDAEIWEYNSIPKQMERLQPATCTERSTAKSYAVR